MLSANGAQNCGELSSESQELNCAMTAVGSCRKSWPIDWKRARWGLFCKVAEEGEELPVDPASLAREMGQPMTLARESTNTHMVFKKSGRGGEALGLGDNIGVSSFGHERNLMAHPIPNETLK